MTNYLIKQTEITRNGLLADVDKLDDKLDDKLFDVQPTGFNNTIHWHIGHILTVTEQFVFGFPKQSQHIPKHYYDLFTNGTKPSDWSGDVPSVATLTEQLKDQLDRIKQIPAEQFEKKLDKPLFGQDTFGGLTAFAVFHEANHIGQIHAMDFAAQTELKK